MRKPKPRKAIELGCRIADMRERAEYRQHGDDFNKFLSDATRSGAITGFETAFDFRKMTWSGECNYTS